MKPDLLRVSTKDKKYTVVQDGEGYLFALRYGEQWRQLTGDNLILALAYELQEARELLKKCKNHLEKPARFSGTESTEAYIKEVNLIQEIQEAITP